MTVFAMPIGVDQLDATDLGRVLAAGRLVATLQSKGSGLHVTVRAACKAKVAGRWRLVPYDLASHVFIDCGDDDRVGTLYPPHSPMRWHGSFFANEPADVARLWTARKVLDICAGFAPAESDQYRLLAGSHCQRCGLELTEPESIEARMGPHCRQVVSAAYGSRHQIKSSARAHLALASPPADPVEALAVPPLLPVPDGLFTIPSNLKAALA